MSRNVTTCICITVVLGQHVDVVEDDTVKVVNFQRLFETSIHQNALVEAALVKLFCNKDAIRNLLTAQKRVKIVQQAFQVELAVLVRHNYRRFCSGFTVSWRPATARLESVTDFIVDLFPLYLERGIWQDTPQQGIGILFTLSLWFVTVLGGVCRGEC